MKVNNTWLLGSLAVLLLILVGIQFTDDSQNKVEVDKNLFKVEDQTKVDRVVIQKSDEVIELKFSGSKWLINNQHEADRQLIKVLFATLLQAEPRRPVAQKVKDSIQAIIAGKGHQVKLYEGEELVKSFLVAGNEKQTETYYQLVDDPTPYLVTIPGYRVYVAAIFELKEMEWRDKRIFNINWQNFKKLTSTFPANAKENFSISYQNNFFGVEGYPGADTTAVNNYLDAISLIQTMQYLTPEESRGYDSLLASVPYNSIEVEDIATRKIKLEIFKSRTRRSAVLARMNGDQLVILNPEDFLQIDRKRSDFIK